MPGNRLSLTFHSDRHVRRTEKAGEKMNGSTLPEGITRMLDEHDFGVLATSGSQYPYTRRTERGYLITIPRSNASQNARSATIFDTASKNLSLCSRNDECWMQVAAMMQSTGLRIVRPFLRHALYISAAAMNIVWSTGR